jgi:hypothetical protein
MKGFPVRTKMLGAIVVLAIFIPLYAQAATLRVEAWIDGRSQLNIRFNSAQWHHFEYSAPGQENGNYPTIFNGQNWFPTWPGASPNYSCGCDSSIFYGIEPPFASVQTVVLNIIQARESVSIIQQPNAGNNYTLIIEFNDNSSGGADWYIIDLIYQGQVLNRVPTMTEWGMIILVILLGIKSIYCLRKRAAA